MVGIVNEDRYINYFHSYLHPILSEEYDNMVSICNYQRMFDGEWYE